MGDMQDKRQESGKGREEQERPRSDRDPIRSGTGHEGARRRSPEERERDETTRERGEDEMRDEDGYTASSPGPRAPQASGAQLWAPEVAVPGEPTVAQGWGFALAGVKEILPSRET
ncbi:hypothetical protein [Streptomyces sp. BF23-19]|uniref:hypothetical protein n=1 Tax=unclassified Streptomyces TaxID=2593676 RepID=UPI0034E4575A